MVARCASQVQTVFVLGATIVGSIWRLLGVSAAISLQLACTTRPPPASAAAGAPSATEAAPAAKDEEIATQVEALCGDDREGRQRAARSLGLLRARAVPALTRALGPGNCAPRGRNREQVIHALGALGADALPALPALIRLARDERQRALWPTIATTLVVIGPNSAAASAELLWTGPEEARWIVAAHALGRLGEPGLEVLLRAALAGSSQTRDAAFDALLFMLQTAEESPRTGLIGQESSYPGLRWSVDRQRAAERVVESLCPHYSRVQVAARATLSVLGTPALICAGDITSWRERAHTGAFSRGPVEPERLERWLALVERDPDPELRRRALLSVAAYAGQDPARGALLERLLSTVRAQPSRESLTALAEALATQKRPLSDDDLSWLIAALEEPARIGALAKSQGERGYLALLASVGNKSAAEQRRVLAARALPLAGAGNGNWLVEFGLEPLKARVLDATDSTAVREAALRAFVPCYFCKLELESVLLAGLSFPQPELRAAAANVARDWLSSSRRSAPALAAALIEGTRDVAPNVRIAAMSALCGTVIPLRRTRYVRQSSPEPIPEAEPLQAFPAARCAAPAAARGHSQPTTLAICALIARLGDRDPEVRRAAPRLLVAAGVDVR
jgi:hypothetical protein